MKRYFSHFVPLIVLVLLPLFAAVCGAPKARTAKAIVAQPRTLVVPNIRPSPVRSCTPTGAFL